MDDSMVKRIQSDPNYIRLVSERRSYGWTLAILMLILYYGYIGVVAFAPTLLVIKVAGVITTGLIAGFALIVISIVLTGIYVMRANSTYDDLTAAIVAANASATGGKK